jgi:hypothetical protein
MDNEKVHTPVTEVTGDVCTKLKIPSSYDGAQSVCKHPHRRQINSHDVPLGNQFVSNDNVLIEEYVKIYCRIVVHAHRTASDHKLRLQNFVRLPKLSAIIANHQAASPSNPCGRSCKPAPTDIFKPGTLTRVRVASLRPPEGLIVRPASHRRAVPGSSAPGPPPGLRSLAHRATISAPSSSAGSRSSAGPVSSAHSPWPAARSRSTMGGPGLPPARVAHLPGLSVHSPGIPFPMHDESMCKHSG